VSATDHAMIEAEQGVVREVADSGGARYGIEITVPGVCDRCAIRDNCYGAGSVVWASADEDLRPGDPVRLDMERGTVLKATAWVYGIPLVAVFLGTLAGHGWLFASRPEQTRVLLSFGMGVGLMLTAGLVLAKLNDWVGKRLTIRARRARG
jgi:positive regulator of sigma E activity